MVASIRPDSMADIQRLLADVRRIGPDVAKEVDQRLKPITDQTATDARTFAPERTGALRRAIQAGRLPRGEAAVWVRGIPYAPIQNDGGTHPLFGRGSYRQEAHHYMERAIDANREHFYRTAEQVIDDVAQKAGFH
jgi:hypothetical protein